ncbi:MAG: BLUF domain-containing protein [Janthinobacterium lividum]
MHTLSAALEWAIAVARSPKPLEPATGPMAHVLYCSKAQHPFTEDELADLLEQTRTNNERCAITGLLCYSYGRFVQVLEGPSSEINHLYTLLERDPRHYQLRLLSQGETPLRQFPDWRVALANAPHDCYWLIPCFEARLHHLLKPQIPIPEPLLCSLLHTFGNLGAPL